MKKLILLLLLLPQTIDCSAPASTQTTDSTEQQSVSALSLKAAPIVPSGTSSTTSSTGQTVSAYPSQGVKDFQLARQKQTDYFFNHLPATQLPSSIQAEIKRVFQPLMPLLPPITPDQTQLERQTEVMNHILSFYGLLYLIAEEQFVAKQAGQSSTTTGTSGTGSATIINSSNETSITAPTFSQQLTYQQIKDSDVWQNHLKIMIGSSYAEEVSLLSKVHENEISAFDYLPQFETNYYTPTFEQLRSSSQLTRLYLLLTERYRTRYLADCNDWKTIVPDPTTVPAETYLQKKHTLFNNIAAFQESPFYQTTMQFLNLDQTQTFPIQIKDTDGNVLTLLQALEKGYRFDEFLSVSLDETGEKITLTLSPFFELLLEITQDQTFDPKDPKANPQIVVTGLGNLVLTGEMYYTFDILSSLENKTPQEVIDSLKTTATQPSTGSSTQQTNKPTLFAHLVKTELFGQFFVAAPEPSTDTQIQHATQSNDVTQAYQDYEHYNFTYGYFELLSFSAMKMLFNDTAPLFESGNLEKAFNLLQTTDLPNFMVNKPEDYMLQKEINDIKDYFDQSGQDATTKAQFIGSILHFLEHLLEKIGHAFEEAAKAAWHGLKSLGKDLLKGVEDLGESLWHLTKFIGDELVSLYYATCILPAMFQGKSFSDSLKEAEKYADKANTQLTKATSDLEACVNDVASAAEAVGDAAATIAGDMLSVVNKNLGADVTGMLEAGFNGIIDYYKDSVNFIITIGSAFVRLTNDAINVIATSLAIVATGQIANTTAWKVLGDESLTLAKDTASAILETLTAAMTYFTDQLKATMQGITYAISALVDLTMFVVSVYTAMTDFWVTFLMTGNVGDSFSAAESMYSNVEAKMNEHRMLITSIVTTAVVIASIVLTGGLDTPFAVGMLVVSIGQMAMSIVGAFQGDKLNIDKKQQQQNYLNNYKEFIANNIPVIENFNTQQATETMVQLEAEIMNQERALLYYQDYLNELFNGSLSSQAYSIGNFVKNLSYPNPTTGVMEADLGSLYGIQTGRMNLTPSGGFAIYNKGRGTFCQEAASLPAFVPSQAPQNPLNTKTAPRTEWFHQKDLSNIPKEQGLKADVIWRSIYDANGPFYIGVYLSERSIPPTDMQAIFSSFTKNSASNDQTTFNVAWEKIDTFNRYLLDFDNLAKMFVLYRTQGKTEDATVDQYTPQLGIYEHEAPTNSATQNTDGWLKTSFPAVTYKRGTWYRMQATLTNGQLATTFWELGDDIAAKGAKVGDTPPQTAVKSVVSVDAASIPSNVSPLLPSASQFSGSMGVITSGVSVEYKVLTPQLSGISDDGTTVTFPQESKQRQQALSSLIDYDFNQGALEVFESKREMAWHSNLEKRIAPQFGKKFTLTAVSKQNIVESKYLYTTKGTFDESQNDYVVFLGGVTTPLPTQVGVDPLSTPAPSRIISLATGTYYDNTGKILGIYPQALTYYQTNYGKLDSTTLANIKNVQTAYFKSPAVVGPFTFPAVKTPTGSSFSLKATPLSNGTFLYTGPSLNKDVPGNDYYVMAQTDVIGITKTGQMFSTLGSMNGINTLVSLITGEVYYFEQGGQQTNTFNDATMQTITLSDSQTTNYLYNSNFVQKTSLSQALQTSISTGITQFKQLEINLAFEAQIEKTAQSAINDANTIATTAKTNGSNATTDNLSSGAAATAAATAATNAAQALTTALAHFKKTPGAKGSTAATTLQNAIDAATAATKAAQTASDTAKSAVTTYLASVLGTGGSTLGSSTSSFGSSSSSSFGGDSGDSGFNDSTFASGFGTNTTSDSAFDDTSSFSSSSAFGDTSTF